MFVIGLDRCDRQTETNAADEPQVDAKLLTVQDSVQHDEVTTDMVTIQ